MIHVNDSFRCSIHIYTHPCTYVPFYVAQPLQAAPLPAHVFQDLLRRRPYFNFEITKSTQRRHTKYYISARHIIESLILHVFASVCSME